MQAEVPDSQAASRTDINPPVSIGQSILRRCLRAMLATFFPLIMRPSVPLSVQRGFLRGLTACGTFAPLGVRRERLQLGVVSAERSRRRDRGEHGDEMAVLYLHGGGFTSGSAATHRAIAGHLTSALGGPVYAIDYRLAPESSAPAAIDDALAAWRGLIGQGWRAEQLAVVGDSAGGNLALLLAQRLAAEGQSPAAVVAFSPWLDLSNQRLSHPAAGDPMIRKPWLDYCSACYRGGLNPHDPQISPLDADLGGLPATLIQVGTDEQLLADSERLLAAAAAQGAPLRLEVYQDYWHVFQAHAGLLSASTVAIRACASFILSARKPAA